MNRPLVTIVTPSLNQGKFIEETILSVVNQTYPVEYIIVDGGSTDETVDVLEKYKGRFLLIQGEDKGQTDAINIGFRRAHGELVGWLNSDDILEPNAVELIVELYRQNPNAAIYAGGIQCIDAAGNLLHIPKQGPATFRQYLWGEMTILQQGSFYRKQLIEEIGYLDDSLDVLMDADLFLKLLRCAPVAFVPQIFASIRWHGETKTSRLRWLQMKQGTQIRMRHRTSWVDVIVYVLRRVLADTLFYLRRQGRNRKS